MINVSLFAINIILGISLWRVVLRPSIIDQYRDELFDIREEVREFYAANSSGVLADPTYRVLRDMLNGYLRLMEEVTIFSAVYIIARLRAGAGEHIQAEINRMLHTDDEIVAAFIAEVRDNAAKVLFGYMVATSPFFWVLFKALDAIGAPFRLAARVYARARVGIEDMSYTAATPNPNPA